MNVSKISKLVVAVAVLATASFAQLLGGTNLAVIKVGKSEISQGKVDSLARMLAQQELQGQPITEEVMKQARAYAAVNLVAAELVRLEVERQKINAPAKKVDSLLTLYKSQYPSEDQFKKALKQVGTNLDGLRTKIELQVESDMLLSKVVPYPTDPTDAEKKAYFDKNKAQNPVNDSIAGVQIYLNIAKTDDAQAIADKKAILSGIAALWRSKRTASFASNVELFQQLAAQNSDDPDAKTSGGAMKPFLAKTMGPEFEKAVKALKVGEVSEAFQAKQGLTIFLMALKNDGKYESIAQQIDMRLRQEREMDRQEKVSAYLETLTKTFPVQYLNDDYKPKAQGPQQ